MSNTFFNITAGTKVLFQYLEGRIVVEEESVTIKSIESYNKALCIETFKEPHKKGKYTFSKEQLVHMKKAFDESKK